MSRLLKVPSMIAEYTLGTMIVVYQLGIVRPLSERQQRQQRAQRAQRALHHRLDGRSTGQAAHRRN